MELKILDSILHSELRPWLLDTTDTRKFSALVKAAKAASPGILNAELQKQLPELLLSDFPCFAEILAKQRPPTASTQQFYNLAFHEIALCQIRDVLHSILFPAHH